MFLQRFIEGFFYLLRFLHKSSLGFVFARISPGMPAVIAPKVLDMIHLGISIVVSLGIAVEFPKKV